MTFSRTILVVGHVGTTSETIARNIVMGGREQQVSPQPL